MRLDWRKIGCILHEKTVTIQLTELVVGQQARIVEIIGGHHMLTRLARMGIHNGIKLSMVSTPIIKRGPVVVSVSGSQVAIGHGMAMKIMVEPLS
jgi:ferrous iron transport protein A